MIRLFIMLAIIQRDFLTISNKVWNNIKDILLIINTTYIKSIDVNIIYYKITSIILILSYHY